MIFSLEDCDPPTPTTVTSSPLSREADRCVKCGLCLPHCPTYLKLANEAESPRGRIALMQALIEDQLKPSRSLLAHLERCLGCRACERACPSGVAYGRLLDETRFQLATSQGRSIAGLPSWLLSILSNRQKLARFSRIIPILKRTRLLKLGNLLLFGIFGQLCKIAAILPASAAEPGLFPANRPSGRSLQLFIGCVTSKADQSAITAAGEVLNMLGYAVHIPTKQACCGALHRHNGDPGQADRFCEINRTLTASSKAEALITLASACHLELIEHQGSSLPVQDIAAFLIAPRTVERLDFEPLPARVALHTPCTERIGHSRALLQRIPQLEILPLDENQHCCGAAGSYLLSQPDLSGQLGEDKLAMLKSLRPDILLTTNTGCAIQFRLLIQSARLDIEVLHPIELIRRQLKPIPFQA